MNYGDPHIWRSVMENAARATQQACATRDIGPAVPARECAFDPAAGPEPRIYIAYRDAGEIDPWFIFYWRGAFRRLDLDRAAFTVIPIIPNVMRMPSAELVRLASRIGPPLCRFELPRELLTT